MAVKGNLGPLLSGNGKERRAGKGRILKANELICETLWPFCNKGNFWANYSNSLGLSFLCEKWHN